MTECLHLLLQYSEVKLSCVGGCLWCTHPEIVSDAGRQVGVGGSGEAARHQTRHRRHLRGEADVTEAETSGQRSHLALVVRVPAAGRHSRSDSPTYIQGESYTALRPQTETASTTASMVRHTVGDHGSKDPKIREPSSMFPSLPSRSCFFFVSPMTHRAADVTVSLRTYITHR